MLYLVLTSVFDNRQLIRACESLTAGLGHAEAHDIWKAAENDHCLQLLYLFSLCHVLLLVHPTCSFDVTYDRMFRALDALRQKALPLLRAAIKDSPVSKEWKLNCRPCPPRLLFVFQMNGALRVTSSGTGGNGTDGYGGINPKNTPLEGDCSMLWKIRYIGYSGKVVYWPTRVVIVSLQSLPIQAFVYVVPGPDEDPIGSLLGHLRSNCVLRESEGSTPVPRQRRGTNRWGTPIDNPPSM